MWVDFCIGGTLLAISLLGIFGDIYLAYVGRLREPWGMIGGTLILPIAIGVLAATILMRRGCRWKWWAQLLPFAIFALINHLTGFPR
jgi:hypothetical protein